MGRIGHYGKWIFKVSRNKKGSKIFSFDGLSSSATANYGEHLRRQGLPWIEYDSQNARTYHIRIVIDAQYKKKPRKVRRQLWQHMHAGKTAYLVVGGHKVCRHKLAIKQMETAYEVIGPRGAIQRIAVDVTFIEDSREKGRRKKKKNRASKNSTAKKKKKSAKNRGYTEHVIKSGDTLWGLAKKYYNDGSKYTRIVNANKKPDGDFYVITNPNSVPLGSKIKIPK